VSKLEQKRRYVQLPSGREVCFTAVFSRPTGRADVLELHLLDLVLLDTVEEGVGQQMTLTPKDWNAVMKEIQFLHSFEKEADS
jgi:hypothetical protein